MSIPFILKLSFVRVSLSSVLNVTIDDDSGEVDNTIQYSIYDLLPALALPFSAFEINYRDYPTLLLTNALQVIQRSTSIHLWVMD